MNEQEKKAFLKRMGYTGSYNEGIEDKKEEGADKGPLSKKEKVKLIEFNTRPVARRRRNDLQDNGEV